MRNNKARKVGDSDAGKHPSIVVGKNGNMCANIGATKHAKRGRHKNILLHKNLNPKDKRQTYVRDDLEYHNKKALQEILNGYKVSKEDYKSILDIIEKNKKKQ